MQHFVYFGCSSPCWWEAALIIRKDAGDPPAGKEKLKERVRVQSSDRREEVGSLRLLF